jgi:hypothetical protein
MMKNGKHCRDIATHHQRLAGAITLGQDLPVFGSKAVLYYKSLFICIKN